MLAEHHLHSQRGVSLFGEDDCEEAVLGIDATERFKKKKRPAPQFEILYGKRTNTDGGSRGGGQGGKGPLKVGVY